MASWILVSIGLKLRPAAWQQQAITFTNADILDFWEQTSVKFESKHNNFHSTKCISWWRHQMETFSALLAICAGNSLVPCEFPAQRPVTRSCDVFFDLHLNKRLSKQSWGWWFETLLRPFSLSVMWKYCSFCSVLIESTLCLIIFLDLPIKPNITGCRVYNWERMVCTWEPKVQDTGLLTTQQLYYTLL